MVSVTPFTPDESRALAEKRTLPRLWSVPLALLGMVTLGFHLLGDHPLTIAALTLFTASMMFCWTSAFHEAVHQTLWGSRTFSIWSGRLIGTLVFVPYHVYREVHIRHHAYLNRPEDWEMWPYGDPEASQRFRRIYAWFDLLCGTISSAFIYSRIYFHRDSPVRDPALRRTIRYEYLMIVLAWGTVWGVTTYLGTWGQHIRGVLIPMWLAGSLQTGRKFTEHLGMASYDPLVGTRTVLPQKWLLRLSSFLNFDIFIHGPHHRHPRTTHTTLRGKMEEYLEAGSEQAYPVYDRYWRAVWAMLPYLLKDPGCGMNAGADAPRVKRRNDIDNFVGDVVQEVAPHNDGAASQRVPPAS